MNANRLVGVTLWRVFVAVVGWYGFDQVTDASRLLPWALPPWWMLGELSQLASLLVVVCYLALAAYPLLVGGRRHEPRRAWLRGAFAVILWLVSITAIFVFDNHGQLSNLGFFFEHLVTPVVVTVDLLVVGQGVSNVRWWYPLTWVIPPLVYFAGLAANNFEAYPGLFDPSDPVRMSLVVGAFLAVILAVGYLFYGVGKLRSFLTDRLAARALSTVDDRTITRGTVGVESP